MSESESMPERVSHSGETLREKFEALNAAGKARFLRALAELLEDSAYQEYLETGAPQDVSAIDDLYKFSAYYDNGQ